MRTELVAHAHATIPSALNPYWVRYDNDFERRKWAFNCAPALQPTWRAIFNRLDDSCVTLKGITGIPDLMNDPARHGAGIHLMFSGGHLSPHLDYAVWPGGNGLERRVNLIVFFDSVDPVHGGGLQLCDTDGRVVETLYPEKGDAVAWECSDTSVHAVEPLGPKSPARLTAASYYLAPLRPGVTRRKAMFLPNRG